MIKFREKIIFDKAGRKKSVVLSYRAYESLREDIHDLAIVAERKNEKTISMIEMKRRLKQDGLV